MARAVRRKRTPRAKKEILSSYPEVDRFLKQAKRRNKKVTLTEDQILSLMSRNCKYCGNPPSMKVRGTRRLRNSIDRVDSSIGYHPENCVPCCKICNLMKQSLTVRQFLSHIERLYEYNKRKTPAS